MKKLLIFFLFMFIVQFAFSLELLDVVDKVQKNLNIKRFSVFFNEHYYYDGSFNKNKTGTFSKSLLSKIKTNKFLNYMMLKVSGLQKGDKTVYTSEHSKLLNDIVSSEKKIEEFLSKLEMYDNRKILFLELLNDVRTFGIEKQETIVLEQLEKIETLIGEIKYIPVDKEFLNNIQIFEDTTIENKKLGSFYRERKIIEANEEYDEIYEKVEENFAIAKKYHYIENNPSSALSHYKIAFNGMYSIFGVIAPDDIIRVVFGDFNWDLPITWPPGVQNYPWICEDLCICYFDLGNWDKVISQDRTNLTIFTKFARDYHYPDMDEYPDWDGFELEYVPGYFTYIAYREKKDYATGITKLDSFINQYSGDWKTGYWNGYKALLQLFQGKNYDAISSANIALPILQQQPASDLQRYKDEIDLGVACHG